MKNHSAGIGEVYRRLSAPFFAVLFFSVLVISGLTYLVTRGQDRNAVQASVHLAEAALVTTRRNLENVLLEYAYWDQAVDKLVTSFDPEWAEDEMGSYLHEPYGISTINVLGPDNQIVYESEGNSEAMPEFSQAVEMLLNKARSGPVSAAPIPATGLIEQSGKVYLASVAVLTTYNASSNVRTDHVLVFTSLINQRFLRGLAEKYLLHGLRLEQEPGNQSNAALPVMLADGTRWGYLVWDPELPGTAVLYELLFGIFAAFILLASLIFVFLRRARAFSMQLANQSELLTSTLNSIDQGIASWDSQNRLLTWNDKCKEFWCDPPNVGVGLDKQGLMQHLANSGGLGDGDADELAKERYLKIVGEGASSTDEFTLLDGRQVSVVRYPMHSGGHTLVYTDVTARRESEGQMRKLAMIDPVTGLPNRLLLFDRISRAIENAQRHRLHVGLIFVDLDFFKTINDTFGHAVGDKLLKQVGDRLRGNVREVDTVSRLGGDEFVILLHDVDMPDGSHTVASKILESFSVPFIIEGHEINVTASLGIAIFPDDGTDAETLLQNSDAAMYHSKRNGRNTFLHFASD